MSRSRLAAVVVCLFALAFGDASGEGTMEFGAPISVDLGPGVPTELLAADLGDDEYLLAYEVGEDPSSSLMAAVVNLSDGSTKVRSTLSSGRNGTLLTDVFGDGQGHGGVVWIEGASPRVALFGGGAFASALELPVGALVPWNCLAASGARLVVICGMVGPAPGDLGEVYAFSFAPDGSLLRGPTPVSKQDDNASGLTSVAMDSTGDVWIAMRDQIQGYFELSAVQVALLKTDGSVIVSAEPLGRTPFRAVLPAIVSPRVGPSVAYLAFEDPTAFGAPANFTIVQFESSPDRVSASASLEATAGDPLRIGMVAGLGPDQELALVRMDILPEDQRDTPEMFVRPSVVTLGRNLSAGGAVRRAPTAISVSSTIVHGNGSVVNWGLNSRIYPITYGQGVEAAPMPLAIAVAVTAGATMALAFAGFSREQWFAGASAAVAAALRRIIGRGTEAVHSDTRERILCEIKRSPGISPRTLRRRMSMGKGAVEYQVDTLARAGLVVRLKEGTSLRLYLADATNRRRMAAGERPMPARVLEALTVVTELSHPQLTAILGVSRQRLDYWLGPMVVGGLVEEKRRRGRRYYSRASGSPIVQEQGVTPSRLGVGVIPETTLLSSASMVAEGSPYPAVKPSIGTATKPPPSDP